MVPVRVVDHVGVLEMHGCHGYSIKIELDAIEQFNVDIKMA